MVVSLANDAELWRIDLDAELRPVSSARVWSGPGDECREVSYTGDGRPLFAGVDSATLIAGGRACRVVDDRSMYSTGADVTNGRLLMTNGRSIRAWEVPSSCAPAASRGRTYELETTAGDVAVSPVATALLVGERDATVSAVTLDAGTLRPVGTLRLPRDGSWSMESLPIGVAVYSHRSRRMWLITSELAATELEGPSLTAPAIPIVLGGELRMFDGRSFGRALPKAVLKLERRRPASEPRRKVVIVALLGVLTIALVLYAVRRRRTA